MGYQDIFYQDNALQFQKIGLHYIKPRQCNLAAISESFSTPKMIAHRFHFYENINIVEVNSIRYIRQIKPYCHNTTWLRISRINKSNQIQLRPLCLGFYLLSRKGPIHPATYPSHLYRFKSPLIPNTISQLCIAFIAIVWKSVFITIQPNIFNRDQLKCIKLSSLRRYSRINFEYVAFTQKKPNIRIGSEMYTFHYHKHKSSGLLCCFRFHQLAQYCFYHQRHIPAEIGKIQPMIYHLESYLHWIVLFLNNPLL